MPKGPKPMVSQLIISRQGSETVTQKDAICIPAHRSHSGGGSSLAALHGTSWVRRERCALSLQQVSWAAPAKATPAKQHHWQLPIALHKRHHQQQVLSVLSSGQRNPITNPQGRLICMVLQLDRLAVQSQQRATWIIKQQHPPP